MKFSKFVSFLSVSAMTLATTLISSRPSFSQEASFFCGTEDGHPATIVRSPNYGNVPIIVWSSGYFESGGYDNQTRCDIVSNKFQYFSDRDTLEHLTAGKVNRQPVICAVASKSSPCNSDSLLFTLKQGTDPEDTLQQLFDVRRGVRGATLNENSNVTAQDRIYVNFEEFLEKKANEESGISSEASSNNIEESQGNTSSGNLF
ncbi:MAG: COP23 domain-containing protein [Cyanobacteria bacterium P01_F01_bin.143]